MGQRGSKEREPTNDNYIISRIMQVSRALSVQRESRQLRSYWYRRLILENFCVIDVFPIGAGVLAWHFQYHADFVVNLPVESNEIMELLFHGKAIGHRFPINVFAIICPAVENLRHD